MHQWLDAMNVRKLFRDSFGWRQSRWGVLTLVQLSIQSAVNECHFRQYSFTSQACTTTSMQWVKTEYNKHPFTSHQQPRDKDNITGNWNTSKSINQKVVLREKVQEFRLLNLFFGLAVLDVSCENFVLGGTAHKSDFATTAQNTLKYQPPKFYSNRRSRSRKGKMRGGGGQINRPPHFKNTFGKIHCNASWQPRQWKDGDETSKGKLKFSEKIMQHDNSDLKRLSSNTHVAIYNSKKLWMSRWALSRLLKFATF